MAHNVFCTVVEVPVVTRSPQPRVSARDLLPWADPYIASLIRNLQQEVKAERAAKRRASFSSPIPNDPLHRTSAWGNPTQSELAPAPDNSRLDFGEPDYESWRPKVDLPESRYA